MQRSKWIVPETVAGMKTRARASEVAVDLRLRGSSHGGVAKRAKPDKLSEPIGYPSCPFGRWQLSRLHVFRSLARTFTHSVSFPVMNLCCIAGWRPIVVFPVNPASTLQNLLRFSSALLYEAISRGLL